MKRDLPALSLCFALVAGCDCGATETHRDAALPPPVLDESALIAFVPRFATESCNADARCGTRFTSLRLGGVPEDCEAEIASTAPYLSWLGHPGRFDADQAEACLSFLSQAPCMDLARALRGGAFAEVCRDVLRVPDEQCVSMQGGAAVGASCTSSVECGAGLRCDLAERACTARAFARGESCEPELGCASRDLVCVQVEETFQCAAARTDGTCRVGPTMASGQRGDCGREHFCRDGLCAHVPELGEPCGSPNPTTCDEDLVCDQGRCVRALLLTQPCVTSASCRTGHCEGGLCALRPPLPCAR